jgi:serine/threonine-protein kinase
MSLIHRDVSPSNVLLSRAGEVKLTDFGIAKRAEQEVTGHGAVRGKFAYISPEQARNEHLDPRSDVFAVGILLWELVTNRRLFSGLGDMDALRAVRNAQVPRPRDADTRLTAEIDALIMSTLAPEPGGRPTAGQLSAKLRSLRYSLDVTVGDPATELAKIIDTAEEVERLSSQSLPGLSGHEYEGAEATVIRIHTADVFSMRDKDGTGMARARQVIDRFDEEETRQALLSPDQMEYLRASAPRDSSDLTAAAESVMAPGRAVRSGDQRTRARVPLSTDDVPTIPPREVPAAYHFEDAEATELLSRAHRRPPPPPPPSPDRIERAVRPSNESPAMPPPQLTQMTPSPALRSHGSTPGPASPTTAHPTPPAMQQPPAPPMPPPLPLPLPPMPSPPISVPSSLAAQPAPPPPAPPPAQPLPVVIPAPPQLAKPPQPPAASYPAYHPAQQGGGPAPVGYPRSMVQRPSTQRPTRRRRSPFRAWMLVIGALLMAGLAFAVTRACIHNATSRSVTDAKPAETK